MARYRFYQDIKLIETHRHFTQITCRVWNLHIYTQKHKVFQNAVSWNYTILRGIVNFEMYA